MAGEITGVRVTGDSTSRQIDYEALANKPTIPTVYAWAQAATKPTYTASEVGALPDSTAIPTKVSDLANDSGFLTSIPVDNATIGLNQSGQLTLLLGRVEEVAF